MMEVLVTGGAGFIGHHVVEHFLLNTHWNITVLDKLSYASRGWDRLRDCSSYDCDRVRCFSWNCANPLDELGLAKEIGTPDLILHMAAQSHVDRSIIYPVETAADNIMGTVYMMEFARRCRSRFIYFSTDEVYGPAPESVAYSEGARFNPGNPYASSKASAECEVMAYANTYQLECQITNTMNVFGERQHPEKYVPLCVNKICKGETITIHASPDCTTPGSRFYIHARNVADALLWVIDNDERVHAADPSCGKYHIVGSVEWDNLTLARMIAAILKADLEYEMVDFHSSRPGHDLRYALNGAKMRSLGWVPPVDAEKSLERTVNWMIEPTNARWMQP